MSEIPRASLDAIEETLAGYSKTADVGDAISDDDVADSRDVSSDVAKRQKRFFVNIGILEKDGHDHLLTERGETLSELIRFNQDDEVTARFRGILNEWEPTDEILAHVEGGISEEDLENAIALVTETDLSSWRHEAGATAVITLLERTGFIEKDQNGQYHVADGNQEPTETGTQVADVTTSVEPTASTPVESGTGAAEAPTPTVGDSPQQAGVTGVSINLDVSGTDDPENVRQLLLAIRKGSREDLENYVGPEADD